MPNGDDRNVVRLTLTLAAYRDEFSQWPSALVISRVIWEHGIIPYLTIPAVEALQSSLNLHMSDEDEATIRAEGVGGSIDYREFDHRTLSVPPLADWLGEAWHRPIRPGVTGEL